jgi:hypothetical protein
MQLANEFGGWRAWPRKSLIPATLALGGFHADLG